MSEGWLIEQVFDWLVEPSLVWTHSWSEGWLIEQVFVLLIERMGETRSWSEG